MFINNLGGIYKTGTVSIENGSNTITGVGTQWTTIAEQGDYILVDGKILIITASITDQALESEIPWAYATVTDVDYVLVKMSWLRYEPAILQQKVRELISMLTAAGLFYFVEGDEPDPGIGSDGQWALKVNDGNWKIWLKVGGAWALQGSPTNIELQGVWDPTKSYLIGDVVSWLGRLWKSLIADNLNNQPDLDDTKWQMVLQGGDRYDLWFFDTDRPASDELINKGFPTGVTFPVGITDSHASAEVASTNVAVFSFKKNGVEFATLTFNPGNSTGVWSCPVETTFNLGDVLTHHAPAVRDPTLSGVGGNLVGFRNVGV